MYLNIFQSLEQFECEGCDNCEEFLRMKSDKDKVFDCTSTNFDGFVYYSLIQNIIANKYVLE